MWENMTFESILNDMLSKISTDVDKREGSVIYDALAPAAYKLAETYFMLNAFLDLVSGDTAVGEFLDRVVADYGIARKSATYAIRKIETTGEVDLGTRWGIQGLVYTITELISPSTYKAVCEQYGAIGNQYSGALENIDNVNGVIAILTDIVVSGADEETDDNLRTRFYLDLQRPATSGNADNYKQWALDVAGIGDAKVLPLWNGPGTVKVVIVDSDKNPATEQLVQAVHSYIETARPVGALVDIVSAGKQDINITAKVSLASGFTIQSVQNTFINALEKYRKEIAFKDTYLSYAAIGNILFGVDGVADYTDLKLNNEMQNIILGSESIPAFIVSLGVM